MRILDYVLNDRDYVTKAGVYYVSINVCGCQVL